MATIIQMRRDTAANWTTNNPTLAEGEEGYETDTKKIKIGDGLTAWTALGYTGGVVNTVAGGTDITVDSTDPSNPIVNFSGATGSGGGTTFTRETLEITDDNAILSQNALTGGPTTAWIDTHQDGTVIAIDNAKKTYTVDIDTGVMTETGVFADYHPRGLAVGSNDVAYYHTGNYLKRVDTGSQDFDLTGKQVTNASGMTTTEDRKFLIAFSDGLADFISIETMSYSHTISINTILTNTLISPLFLGDYVYTIYMTNDTILRFPLGDLTSSPTTIQTLLNFNANTHDRSIFKTSDNKIAISSGYTIDGVNKFGISVINPEVISEEIPYGDMTKSTYDTDDSGVVDDAEKVNGLTVETAVPSGAVFVDTVYSHPTGDGNLHVPETSTTSEGKVLTAGATAGVMTWETPVDFSSTETTYTAPQISEVTVANTGAYSLADGNKFSSTPTANMTIVFSNIAGKDGMGGSIFLDNSGGHTISKDASIKCPDDLLTTVSVAGVYILGFEEFSGSVYVTTTKALS